MAALATTLAISGLMNRYSLDPAIFLLAVFAMQRHRTRVMAATSDRQAPAGRPATAAAS